jgi:hypothetical protein
LGNIFVTEVGGGVGIGGVNNWKDISAGLDGSDVMKIVPNPTRGSHEAYAVTENGVYHMLDYTVPGATWINITANIFDIKTLGFRNNGWEVGLINDQAAAITQFNSIAVDWRPLYAPTAGVPILYVAGDGGVVRSTNVGLSCPAKCGVGRWRSPRGQERGY